MRIEELTPRSVPSSLERVVGKILSPARVGYLLLASAGFILALALFIPAWLAPQYPDVAQMGQNTLLALAALGWVLTRSANPGQISLTLPVAVLVVALGGVTIVQLVANWYPPDSLWRLLLNTAPGSTGWPGRMSWPAATLFFILGIAQILWLRQSAVALTGAAVLTIIAAFLSTSAVTAELINLNLFNQLPGLAGRLSPLTTILLLVASLAMGLALLNSPMYLSWERDHVGQGVFIRITALLSMLLVATVVSAIGFTLRGEWDFALLIVVFAVVFSFLLVYQRITTVVDNSVRAHLDLEERSFLLAQAQAQARLGSWRLTLPEAVLEWSPQCYEIFGLPHDQPMTVKRFLDCVHPEDREQVSRHWEKAMAGDAYDIEHRICVDGKTRWVRERAELLWNETGTECVCLGTVQDITNAKERELELIRSSEHIRRLAAHNEIIRENERRTIARELHDEMGQHLTALRMQLAMLQMQFGQLDATLDHELGSLRETVGELIATSRDVASSLRPLVLDAGLASAAEWLLNTRLSRNSIAFQLDCDIDESKISDEFKTMIFRVLQESITNVIKHANAQQVLVSVRQDEDDLVLTVSDDGIGFDPDNSDSHQRFGLVGMRERVLTFKGQIRVDSQPGDGTLITVRVPLHEAHRPHGLPG